MSKKINLKKIHPLSAIILLALIAWGVWSLMQPTSYGVCFQGFNYTDKSIAKYSVNGLWGGRISAKEVGNKYGGGGGFSCGASVAGPKVKIKWVYNWKSVAEMDAGVIPESHEVTLPFPEAESRSSRYFQVHIHPDNRVELKLLDLPKIYQGIGKRSTNEDSQ